jgi:hypothetical protein
VKLAEPWESLRDDHAPKPSEEEKAYGGQGRRTVFQVPGDENYKRALFYAALALEEAFGVYRSALKDVAEGLRRRWRRGKSARGRLCEVMYMLDLGRLTQLAEEGGQGLRRSLEVLSGSGLTNTRSSTILETS